MNQPHTHEQLTKEFKDILQPFKAESIAGRCADIVIRERMKMLSLRSLTHEETGTIVLERIRSHSDKSTGEWLNHNPHDPAQKGIE